MRAAALSHLLPVAGCVCRAAGGHWWAVSLLRRPSQPVGCWCRRGLTIRRSSAALRLLASPTSVACAAPGGGSRSHPGASAAACPTTQQTPTPQGVRVWIFMRCNGCLCLRFRLPGHLPGIYHCPVIYQASTTFLTNFHGVSPCTQRFVPTFRDKRVQTATNCHEMPRSATSFPEISEMMPSFRTFTFRVDLSPFW